MDYKVLYSCVSHAGRCRRMNQDNFICDGRYMDGVTADFPIDGCLENGRPAVLGVFDGMGGEERGEMAALLAAQEASGITWQNRPSEDLRMYCRKANARICRFADQNGIQAMGTTAALLAFSQKGITLCNIGDSRIFRFTDSGLEQLSVDHVAAAAYGCKPPLSQNLGIPPTEMLIDPYLADLPYEEGDVYLICSDGLTDMLSPDEITEILKNADFDEAAGRLLEGALENGGRDNITAILCKIVPDKRRWIFQMPLRKAAGA